MQKKLPVFMGTMTPQEMDDYIRTLPNPYGHDLLTVREISMGLPIIAKTLLENKKFKPDEVIEQYLSAAGVNTFVVEQGIKNHYEGSDIEAFCPSYTQWIENYEMQKEQERVKEDERNKLEPTLSSSQRKALEKIRALEKKLPNGTNVHLIAVVGLSGTGKSYALDVGGIRYAMDSLDHLYDKDVVGKLYGLQPSFHRFDRFIKGSGQMIIALTPRELEGLRGTRKEAARHDVDNIGSINVVPMKGMTLSETIQFLSSQPEADGRDIGEIEKIAHYSMGIALLGKQLLLSPNALQARNEYISKNLRYDPNSEAFKELAAAYLQIPLSDDPTSEVVVNGRNDEVVSVSPQIAAEQRPLGTSSYPIELSEYFYFVSDDDREKVIEDYEKKVGFPITPPAYTVPQSVEIVDQMVKSPRQADNLYSVYTPYLTEADIEQFRKEFGFDFEKNKFFKLGTSKAVRERLIFGGAMAGRKTSFLLAERERPTTSELIGDAYDKDSYVGIETASPRITATKNAYFDGSVGASLDTVRKLDVHQYNGGLNIPYRKDSIAGSLLWNNQGHYGETHTAVASHRVLESFLQQRGIPYVALNMLIGKLYTFNPVSNSLKFDESPSSIKLLAKLIDRMRSNG